ncbi:MAG: hypothetical protein WAW61_14155 [Methylococcaceae bacterium]
MTAATARFQTQIGNPGSQAVQLGVRTAQTFLFIAMLPGTWSCGSMRRLKVLNRFR